MGEKAEYDNWVSKRIIFLSGFFGFVFLASSLVFWVFIFPSVLFFLLSVCFLYVRARGALTIKLAQKYPKARVIGIDFWGKTWDYSKKICEKNAVIEGVSDRVEFQKANAESLPFDEGYFDAVVSNFVFHMVGKAKDKRGGCS
jgi:hypothetical protein